MVRPAAFGYNAETAATNTFQQREAPKAAGAAGAGARGVRAGGARTDERGGERVRGG